jgi:hypothetical protein
MDTSNNTINLDTPIKRGETEITALTLRKPNAGALRGVGLRGLLEMEVDAISKVLPRISEPALTDADVARMDPADLLQAGAVIAGFLLPKRALAEAQAASPYPLQ